MIADKIKIRVSYFVYMVLYNDAQAFGFVKDNNESNLNALLNRLIPSLLEIRKYRRDEIHYILTEENQRSDAEKIYECVNEIIDRVYFSDQELNKLDTEIWLRPSKNNAGVFDEINDVETVLTRSELSVVIRGMLNEYARFPMYKRETIAFAEEFNSFFIGCQTGQIYHFRQFEKTKSIFPFNTVYGFVTDQRNYLIGYELESKKIKAFPLREIRNSYLVQKRYTPSGKLIDLLNDYANSFDFESEIEFKEEQ